MVTNGEIDKMIDLTPINYALPLFSFVLVFVLFFAILKKTEVLGDNAFIQAIISVIIALIFISLSNVRSFVELITPWFSVLIVILFFGILIVMFMLKEPEKVLKPGLAIGFLVVFAIIVFYLWFTHFHISSNHTFLEIKRWFFHREVVGTFWLAVVTLVVGFVITRK